jgi:hypothetical protein
MEKHMYRIFRIAAAPLFVLALAGCNEAISSVASTAATTIAELSKPPAQLKPEDIKKGDVKLIAEADGGIKDFVVTSNGIAAETSASASAANTLILNKPSDAAELWEIAEEAIESLDLAYEDDTCDIDPETGAISYCELVLDGTTVYIESDLDSAEDANGNYSMTGSLWVAFEDADSEDFVVIGLDDIINDGVVDSSGEVENLSMDVLLIAQIDGQAVEGWVTVRTFNPYFYPTDPSTGDTADDAISGILSMTDEAGNTFYYSEYLEDNNWVTYDELGTVDDTPITTVELSKVPAELKPADIGLGDIKLIAQADEGLRDFLVTSNGIEEGGSGGNDLALASPSDAADYWSFVELGFAVLELADEADNCEIDPITSYITYCEVIVDEDTFYIESEADYTEFGDSSFSSISSIWVGLQDPTTGDFIVIGLDNIIRDGYEDDTDGVYDLALDVLIISSDDGDTVEGWVTVDTYNPYYYTVDSSTGDASDLQTGTLSMTDEDDNTYYFNHFDDDADWVAFEDL